MATIITRYVGATNTRGSRIVAKLSTGKSISVPWNHSLSDGEKHDVAAAALAKKMGWGGEGMKFCRGHVKGGGVLYVTQSAGNQLDLDHYKHNEVAAIVKKLRKSLV
jgi:hypothetical protein